MASFSTPPVHVNQVGWGPTDLPEKFLSLPFNPFSKGDKVGIAADFSVKDPRFANRRFFRDQEPPPVVDPNEVFQQVEDPTKKVKALGFGGRGGFRGGFRGRGGGFRGGARSFMARREAEEAALADRMKGKKAKYLMQHTRRGKQFQNRGGGPMRGGFRRWNRRDTPTLEPSVKIETSWRKVEEFELAQLNRVTMTPPVPKDIKWCGSLLRYDDAYEHTSTKNVVPLKRFAKTVFNNTTSIDDPEIQQLAQEMSGKGRLVMATDEVLAHMMAAPRSVLPWDLYFTRFENGLMFIDKRDEAGIEMLSVDETLGQRNQPQMMNEPEKPPLAPCDTPDKLAIEATAINQNFSQQVVNRAEKKKAFEHPNPLWSEEDAEPGTEPASFAYRYRQWSLGEDLTLVARTELHAYTRKTGLKKGSSYMTLFALNEANPKISGSPAWRQKIDSARGSVVAQALKNNSCKIAKWTAQSLLSGADQMKIGFVSRKQVRDPLNHEVLGTQFYNPVDFAAQISFVQNNAWAIIKGLCERIYAQPPGKYVLMRDPNKPMLMIYEVPMNSFTGEEETEADQEYDGVDGLDDGLYDQ
jgi:translation initiation factor 3 subunit D